MNDIAANLARVRDAIVAAADAAGRRADEIKLIAVSKTHPVDAITVALHAGQHAFGESTVQEGLDKMPALAGRDVEWHFVGHLQSNKAKSIPGQFAWVHSLDSVRLAQRLSRLAQEKAATVNALIEVNVTRDPHKHGVAPDRLYALLDALTATDLAGVSLRGLMAIGPHRADVSTVRTAFAALRRLQDECRRRYVLADFTELSMGMSGDYREAIQEGATMLRLGTAIFGERDYRSR
jgi:PLP dependent protein